MENIMSFEQQINTNIDLIEIARDYCEYNHDKSIYTSSLISLLEIVLQNQKKLIAELDKTMLQ